MFKHFFTILFALNQINYYSQINKKSNNYKMVKHFFTKKLLVKLMIIIKLEF